MEVVVLIIIMIMMEVVGWVVVTAISESIDPVLDSLPDLYSELNVFLCKS